MSTRQDMLQDTVVFAVGAGIREFNRLSPPGEIRFKDGVQVPPTPTEQQNADQQWHQAIRHGLDKALPLMPLHFNGLTPAEAERLAVLIEEAAEVQHIASKILRHGYQSFNPDLIVNQSEHGPKLSNREMLEKEIGHFSAAVHRMFSAHDLIVERVGFHERRKKDTGGMYMHHQPDAPETNDD